MSAGVSNEKRLNERFSWLIFVLASASGLATAVMVDRHFHHGYSDGTTFVLASGASGFLGITLLALRFRSNKPLPWQNALIAGMMPSLILCVLQLFF
jgi:hypothetical protein